MKARIILPAILALIVFPIKSFAQMDERAPGIYTVVGSESRHLKYTNGGATSTKIGVGGISFGNEVFHYKGETSGVEASNKFVLVVDPKRIAGVQTMSVYNIFLKNMTPSNVLVIPLTVNCDRERREYDPGKEFGGFNVDKKNVLEFEWDRISDNSFEIRVFGLKPGEYGFVFRAAKLASFNYTGLYGFTIAEPSADSSAVDKPAIVPSDAASGTPANATAILSDEIHAADPGEVPAKDMSGIDAIASEIAGSNNEVKPYNLWNGNYDKTNCDIIVGYVNKSWRCTYESGIEQREDFFGDPDDKYLHGFQIGAVYTPSFDWGLGLRTGLFLEFYQSRSKWITSWCNHFSEADMYIPLHASFRFPIAQQVAFNLYGGMGFQWAMSGSYYRTYAVPTYWWRRPWWRPISEKVAKQEYGNGWPQRVNWQAECGFTFRYKWFAVGFTYSFGIVEQGIENSFDEGKTFIPAAKSRQDKMNATVAFTF